MFNWIKNYLCDRTIQVKIGNELSDEREVENGPVVFNVLVNGMFSKMGNWIFIICT